MDQKEVPVGPYGKKGAVASIALSVVLVWISTPMGCWGILASIHASMGADLRAIAFWGGLAVLLAGLGAAIFFSDKAVARLNQLYGKVLV